MSIMLPITNNQDYSLLPPVGGGSDGWRQLMAPVGGKVKNLQKKICSK